MLIGSHISPQDPLATAAAENADVVQIFLGNPQSWKAPTPREDAAELKAAALPIYVHAPYLINVASANNRVRIPSRKILQQTCDAAAQIGAAAVIVHGGHVRVGYFGGHFAPGGHAAIASGRRLTRDPLH